MKMSSDISKKCQECGKEIEIPFGPSKYCKKCGLKIKLAKEKAYFKEYRLTH